VSRFPELSAAGTAVPASIFARLREHLARFPGDVIPLQIGDTHLAPPARLDDVVWAELAATDLYAYGSPEGWGPLVDALAAKAVAKNRIPVTRAGVQVAVGATHALSCTVQALCDPGDELILLTPHWPLIRGMALGLGVVPVEIPFDGDLEAAITSRTTAIYFATPNNPDGTMLGEARLAQIAELAVRHGLWILADAHATYRALRDRARARLQAPAACPPGGAYLWVDFQRWTGNDCMPILERCAAAGVLCAPGNAFGVACGGFARLCFTGVEAARLDEGIDRINAVLASL